MSNINRMDTSAIFEMFETMNKKLDIIQANCKTKENQPINQPVSKEEIEEIVEDKSATIANYIELKIKQQTENQTRYLTEDINSVCN